MKDQIRVSVSQIRKYKRCARSWWYEYGPLQDKSPSKPSAKLGTMVHDILEKYQTDGVEPPDTKAGRIAACGLHNLPDPAGLEIEKSITLPLSENSKILCRIDMLGTDRAYVGDHKTTSDFKWAKTRAELDTDVQLLTYAYAAYHKEKPPTVDAELLYYRTRGLPVSMVVGCKLPWATIEKNWETIGQIAEEMAPKKADPDGGSCAGNPSACSDYGGCYHAPKCPFSPQNRAATNKPLDNIASHDNNISAEATAPKKETKKMDKKIQDIFGILPPDVAPEEDQTATLEAETSKKLAEMVDLFGGAVPAQAVKEFLIRQGVARTRWPDVLKAADIDISGQTVAAKAPAPAPAAPEFQAQRSKGCTVDTLKALAAELSKKVEAADGGIAEDTIRAWFAGEIAPKKITTLRWNRLVEFSGLTLDGCWFTSPDANGYTEEPEPLTGAEADRAAYEKKTGKKAPVFDHKTNGHPPDYTPQIAAYKIQAGKKAPAPAPTEEETRIKNLTKGAPAIGNRLVVMVDAHFSRTPAHAFHLSVFLAPYIAALEAREQKPFYILDLDHGKGPKLLTGVIAAAWHQDPPVGLITMSALDPLASRVLPLFEKAGALIVYGRR